MNIQHIRRNAKSGAEFFHVKKDFGTSAGFEIELPDKKIFLGLTYIDQYAILW